MSRRTLALAGQKLARLATVAVDLVSHALAVQLGRQANANAMSLDEIASDAIELARLGRTVRRAIERNRNPDAPVAAARAIARRYDAELFDLRDLAGTVMGIKFSSGLYSCAYRNVFFIA